MACSHPGFVSGALSTVHHITVCGEPAAYDIIFCAHDKNNMNNQKTNSTCDSWDMGEFKYGTSRSFRAFSLDGRWMSNRARSHCRWTVMDFSRIFWDFFGWSRIHQDVVKMTLDTSKLAK